jgi:hypothetical protein
MGAAPGTGIPNPYPLAINQPLDRAYLRPLQEPLYDTEVLDFTSPAQQLTYFQRPISQSTAALAITKTPAETNLNQSSMLDYPREFSILGFNIEFDSTIGIKSVAAAYRRAFFLFTFSGRRPYLQIPFMRIPQGMGLEGAIASTVAAGATDSGKTGFAKNGMGHIANYYRFNLGRSALKMKPSTAASTGRSSSRRRRAARLAPGWKPRSTRSRVRPSRLRPVGSCACTLSAFSGARFDPNRCYARLYIILLRNGMDWKSYSGASAPEF